jgi:DNA-binding NarL/FixJ family response regulator
MKILIADDYKIIRQEIKGLLEEEPDFTVIDEAGNGPDAVRKSIQHKPDILVTDLKMPGLNGIEVTERVRRSSPGTRVIILTMYGGRTYINSALNAGAMGYVLKKTGGDNLTEAIYTVASGSRYLSPGLEKYLNE